MLGFVPQPHRCQLKDSLIIFGDFYPLVGRVEVRNPIGVNLRKNNSCKPRPGRSGLQPLRILVRNRISHKTLSRLVDTETNL